MVSAKVAWNETNIIISTRYAWMVFFLFKILDHGWTTCFVFANLLEILFKTFCK
jgi:hypothetical protein